jgi:hypothetical protein
VGEYVAAKFLLKGCLKRQPFFLIAIINNDITIIMDQ